MTALAGGMSPVPEKITGKLERMLKNGVEESIEDVLDISNETIRPLQADKVCDEWAGEPNKEEEGQCCTITLVKRKPTTIFLRTIIDLTFGELPSRADNTPNNASGSKNFG